jgi:hypothetical protein
MNLEAVKIPRKNLLTPVTFSGVLIPWSQILPDGKVSEHQLITSHGLEYWILEDSEWKEILHQHCWKEVKIVGLLNASQTTLIPQRIYLKGPAGEAEKLIDLADWKRQELLKQWKKKLKTFNDLVLIPAAVMALMVF